MRRSIVQSSRILASKKFISQQRFLHSTPSLLKDVLIKVPSMGDSISSGEINEWVKKPGQACVEDEVICTIDTDKVSVEIRAPEAGVLKAILANAKDTVEVGKDIAIIDTDGKPSATPAAAATPSATTTTTTPTPSTPSTPTPTATPTPTPKKEEVKPQSSAPTTTTTSGLRTERRVKMTRIRAKIAERLKQAQNTYAMLTTFNEIDMKKIMELRKVNQEEFQDRHDGLKLGFMGAFCKAASIALTEVPAVNGVIDGNELVYRDYVDISVAVATPNGLVVPVVRNCETKSIAQIERDISNLGEKARKNAITLDDMQGGTFTISNGGVFGSLMGTPIINPPQSAILGMHATKNRPIAIGDQVVVRPMMYVALTYDHRIIDGREAVTFLKRVKELIEDPEKMLLF